MAEPARQLPATSAGRTRRGLVASLGAIGAAVLASLCCIGPLLFVTLGVGAGLASTFEPLRPLFTALTVGLLALGFYIVYARKPAGMKGAACAVRPNSRRDKVLLWIATVVSAILLTFPEWSVFLI